MSELTLALPLLALLSLQSTIDPGTVASLATALRGLPRLTKLHLQSSLVDDEGLAILACALPSLPLLAELAVDHNNDLKGLTAESFVFFADALAKLPLLTVLDLSYDGISSACAFAPARALPGMPLLSQLDLRGNAIGRPPDLGAMALATASFAHPRLMWLDLRQNLLGPAAQASLRAMLAAASPRLELLL